MESNELSDKDGYQYRAAVKGERVAEERKGYL